HGCRHTTCHVRDYVGVRGDAPWSRDSARAVAHPVRAAEAEESAQAWTYLDRSIDWTAHSGRRHRGRVRRWPIDANFVTPNSSAPDPSGHKFGNRHADCEIAKTTGRFSLYGRAFEDLYTGLVIDYPPQYTSISDPQEPFRGERCLARPCGLIGK